MGSKKLLIINGSARSNGNTAAVLKKLSLRLGTSLNCETISLADCRIGYCLGCHTCETTRKCVQRDDMDPLLSAMERADLILIASPSYWGYVTGQLKVFFDRSTPVCNTIPGGTTFPAGKKGLALAIRAGTSPGENKMIQDAIHHYFSHLEIESAGSLAFESIRTPEDANRDDVTAGIDRFATMISGQS
jgi:multimeric flavodoxin WrbA